MNSIVNSLKKYMIAAGEMNKLNGYEKKKFVMDSLKQEITLDNEIEDIILNIIDLIIDIDKGKLIINKKVTKIFSCFNC